MRYLAITGCREPCTAIVVSTSPRGAGGERRCGGAAALFGSSAGGAAADAAWECADATGCACMRTPCQHSRTGHGEHQTLRRATHDPRPKAHYRPVQVDIGGSVRTLRHVFKLRTCAFCLGLCLPLHSQLGISPVQARAAGFAVLAAL